jgi:hypothetical protein
MTFKPWNLQYVNLWFCCLQKLDETWNTQSGNHREFWVQASTYCNLNFNLIEHSKQRKLENHQMSNSLLTKIKNHTNLLLNLSWLQIVNNSIHKVEWEWSQGQWHRTELDPNHHMHMKKTTKRQLCITRLLFIHMQTKKTTMWESLLFSWTSFDVIIVKHTSQKSSLHSSKPSHLFITRVQHFATSTPPHCCPFLITHYLKLKHHT